MMSKRKILLTVALVPAALLAVPALAQASLAMLDKLDKGGWDVRFREDGSHRKVCLRSGRELIQLGHSDAGCNRFVVDDTASLITVQYTCRGNGYGRTTIRRESGGLVQIESQGIAGGKPFQFSAEARKAGPC